ncbi:MAG: DUF885 domain-containing protein [Bacteroidetes bacterium]|nr:DUF885 domain-containing protein [Bacteroidota bacterium]
MTNTSTRGLQFAILAAAALTMLTATASSLRAQHTINPNEPKPTLYELLDSEWASLMHEFPEWATEVGYPGQNDRWSELAPEATGRRREDLNEFLAQLRWGNRQQYLDEQGKSDFKAIQSWAIDRLAGYAFHDDYLLVSQQSGPQIDAVGTLDRQPHATLEDYNDILARLRALPKLIDQTIAMLQRGIDQHIVQPKIIMRGVPDQIAALIPTEPLNSPLLARFVELPTAIAIADRDELNRQAQQIYASQIVPAFEKFRDFMVKTYIPHCRETIGMRDLPKGPEWYKWKAAHHTTTNYVPDVIFEMGTKEVERIRKEMDSVRQAAGFSGDLTAYFDFLRHDKQFFYTDSASLVAGYREIVEKAQKGLPTIFSHIPSSPLVVLPVPAYAAKEATTAYYEPGSAAAHRPGVYRVNTYDLSSRPKWEMQPLSLHEAVPGHHLQLSYSDEQHTLPDLRKYLDYTAYVEGWALYAESLGDQLGFYTTPADRMGQLSYEMWRAIRLVVDVGIHWKGWTREQAIEYFTKNVPKASHDIEVEVDRYIADPGQALAYKMGEMRIREMLDYTRSELTPDGKFDLKAFHDQVLSMGPLPMEQFERQLKAWVFTVRGPRDVVGKKPGTPGGPAAK